jgi:hypothetical protein
MTTQVDIANRALAQIGTRSQLTGLTINPAESAEALYSSLLYAPLRDFLLTEGDYDFSSQLVAAVGAAGVPLWPFAYVYPTGALRIRQLVPITLPALDPQPLQWNIISVSNVRRIVSQNAAGSILITAAAIEDLWDPIFTEAYTRLLASALAFAVENRIEASKEKLSEAISFAGIANLRDP